MCCSNLDSCSFVGYSLTLHPLYIFHLLYSRGVSGTYPDMHYSAVNYGRYSIIAPFRNLIVSYERRSYHHPSYGCPLLREPNTCPLLHHRMIVEPSAIRGLAADCPFLIHLGFNHMQSVYFFLLSQPSQLGIFHPCAVVYTALGVSSNSMDQLLYKFLCTRTISNPPS